MQCTFAASALDPDTYLPSNAQAILNPALTTVSNVSYLLQNTRSSSPASRYGALAFIYTDTSVISGTTTSFTQSVVDQCNSIGGSGCQYYGKWGFTIYTNFTALHGSVLYQVRG